MPIVEVTVMEGRSVAQKRAMIAAVSRVVSETMCAPLGAVRVIIHELVPEHYAIGGVTVGEQPPGHLGTIGTVGRGNS